MGPDCMPLGAQLVVTGGQHTRIRRLKPREDAAHAITMHTCLSMLMLRPASHFVRVSVVQAPACARDCCELLASVVQAPACARDY